MAHRDRHGADVVVVGSGATGGWAAKTLAEAGLRVIVVEAGRQVHAARDQPVADYWQYRSDVHADFADPTLAARQPIQSQHPLYTPRNHHFYVDDLDNPYTTAPDQPFLWIRSRHQGGRSLIWGGQTWRMSDYELAPVAPADIRVTAWPLSYAELAPCYDEVERFMGVSGNADGIREIPDGVFAPTRPLTATEAAFQAFARDRFGRTVIATRAIVPDRAPEEHAGSSAWPRFSSLGSTLAAALRTGRASVETDAVVRRVLVDTDSGRATGVECVDANSRETFTIRASAVVLCASTIESARILLGSHPRGDATGLGNGSGVLGRYLSDHCHAWLAGFVPARFLRPGEAAQAPLAWNGDGLYMPRFRNRDRQETDYYGGFGCMLLMQRRGMPTMDERLHARGSETWFYAGIFGEVLPRPESRITLGAGTRDAWGIPAPHVEYTYSDNEARLLDDASRTVETMLREFGCDIVRVERRSAPGIMVHEVGTARMGRSRADSYLDSHCRSWEVPNLFVTDGAAWPTAGYQNPTLTMMALTVRACRFLADRATRNAL